jgi:uncharacterized protein YeaO (DUF488 family)
MNIRIKRIYEPAVPPDGYRILVDRLWPRGIKKESASVDVWLKEVAPSTSLRTWFAHDPRKWNVFKQKYLQELTNNEGLATLLETIHGHKVVTLLYGARDTEHNQAVVLKEYLEKMDSPHEV